MKVNRAMPKRYKVKMYKTETINRNVTDILIYYDGFSSNL